MTEMTKEECIKNRYWDEKYFCLGPDENGYLSIFDRETGEKMASLKHRKKIKADKK